MRERQREKDLGRDGQRHSGERKWCEFILTIGLNQQHSTPENLLMATMDRLSVNQTFGCVLHSLIDLAPQHSLD